MFNFSKWMKKIREKYEKLFTIVDVLTISELRTLCCSYFVSFLFFGEANEILLKNLSIMLTFQLSVIHSYGYVCISIN